MMKLLELEDYNVNFICPTYKHTISPEIYQKYVTEDIMTPFRGRPMKKSELSLCINYQHVVDDIISKYDDGLFIITESDVFVKMETLDNFEDFLSHMETLKADWDIIHFGQALENEIFKSPYCSWLLPYRPVYDNKNNISDTFIEDITSPGDTYRLVRKLYPRCTDSLLWTYRGLKRFHEWMIQNKEFNAPFDYYLINFMEHNTDIKMYWSLDTFTMQGSLHGLDYSTIQNDYS